MQTSTQQPRAHRGTTKRQPAAAAPVRPRLPGTEHPGFWLGVLLITQHELDTLTKHRNSAAVRKAPDALQDALFTAQRLMREDLHQSVIYVVKEGLLPFAHAHTTYFAQQVAA